VPFINKNLLIVFSAIALAVLIMTAVNIPFTQAGHVRIVVLLSHNQEPYKETLKGFQQHLHNQGVRIDLEIYNLNGNIAMAENVLHNIKNNRDIILFTLGAIATETAIREKADIPIIAGMVMNSKLLVNAENATGVVLDFPIKTQFQWLQRFVPHAKTIGVIYNPETNQAKIDAAREFAKKVGLKLEAQEVRTPQELPSALKNMSNRADVLWGIPDQLVLNPQTARHILLFSFRNQIPFIGLSANWVRAGALYSLEWDYTDLGMQCGSMAYAILQGTHIRSLLPDTPRTVKYCVNRKTAQNIKVEIPEKLLIGAHVVY
jgi:putative ABC transport system substrate-binding protein